MATFVMRTLVGGLALMLSGAVSSVDLSGHPVDPLAVSDSTAVVLFFVATDCSVSNRYVPEIQRLQMEFAGKGVRSWIVYPNPEDTATVVSAHNAEFGITAETVLDRSQSLVQRAHVVATPEAAVFAPQGGGLSEVYHGRIDDRYLSFGHERPQAEHHDLEVAIRAALEHRPVPAPGGDPVGCAIVPLRN
jgi:hypothetical protein